MTAVLDTSALGRLFLEEPGHAALRAWFEAAVERGEDLLAPGIGTYELGRVIERTCPDLSPPDQDTLLHLVLQVVRHEEPPSTAIFDQARAHGLTFYDAAFLALAKQVGATLLTFDAALLSAARAEGLTTAP